VGVKVQIHNCLGCRWFVIYLNIIGRKFVRGLSVRDFTVRDVTIRDVTVRYVTLRDVTVRDVTPNSSQMLIKHS